MSGAYPDTATNAAGCDSIIILDLTLIGAIDQVQKGQDIDGEFPDDRSGYTVAMADANTVAIGAILNSENGPGSGHTRIYAWNGLAWVQKGTDIEGEFHYDQSGFSLSMPDANTVAIGAPDNDGIGDKAGHVRIFSWNGLAWVQKGGDIDGEALGDLSGTSVSMPDQNTVAIGAIGSDGNGNNSGHVRVFIWNGSAWVQKGSDMDGETISDSFGHSVSMPDANTVVSGTPFNDGNGVASGHTRVYAWNGSNWIQKGVDLDGEAPVDFSGESVSMPDANTLAIGACANDGNGLQSGHTRIYQWNGTAWIQKGADIDGEYPGDRSGSSVSMPNANTVAIGATFNPDAAMRAGHVRIYSWDGSGWQKLYADIDGESSYDESSWSISMVDSNAVAIGAPGNDETGLDAGHVRVYSIIRRESFQNATACDSYTWPQNGQTYTSSGMYTDTVTNSVGCDSLLSLNLTVNNSIQVSQTVNLCDSNSYFWAQTGQTYTTSGAYSDTSSTTAGCDSIVTLNLSLRSSSSSTQSATACDSYIWSTTGQTYSASGNYTVRLSNSIGCDSLVTLNLTLNNSVSTSDSVTACDQYTWLQTGQSYTASGVYSDTLTNTAGCDSVLTLTLALNSSDSSSFMMTACDSYTWAQNGQTYTISGTYIDSTTTVAGCDSILTLNLTINRADTAITNNAPTLIANASGVMYQWIDCNNGFSAINGATNQSFTAPTNGSYAVIITQNSCTDTSGCITVNNVGILENTFSTLLQVHPNPTLGELTLDWGQTLPAVHIIVKNVLGQEVLNQHFIAANKADLTLSGPAGPYVVEVIKNETERATLKVIKQ